MIYRKKFEFALLVGYESFVYMYVISETVKSVIRRM